MKIYFPRHGETEWNSRDVICGTTDIGLTARGIGQAEALAADIAVNHRDIDMIICSPMKRAMATAAPIGAALEIEATTADPVTLRAMLTQSWNSAAVCPTEENPFLTW